jgi:hypothetical protein
VYTRNRNMRFLLCSKQDGEPFRRINLDVNNGLTATYADNDRESWHYFVLSSPTTDESAIPDDVIPDDKSSKRTGKDASRKDAGRKQTNTVCALRTDMTSVLRCHSALLMPYKRGSSSSAAQGAG